MRSHRTAALFRQDDAGRTAQSRNDQRGAVVIVTKAAETLGQRPKVLSFGSPEPVPNADPPSMLFSPGAALSKPGDKREAVFLLALNAAVILARSGDRQTARQQCAAAVFAAQPLVAARPKLLRAILYTLLATHSFQLLSRFVLAIGGSTVEVTLYPGCRGRVEQPGHRLESRCIRLIQDQRWLDSLSNDDLFLIRWCDALIAK
jgi:hypothetical protein